MYLKKDNEADADIKSDNCLTLLKRFKRFKSNDDDSKYIKSYEQINHVSFVNWCRYKNMYI